MIDKMIDKKLVELVKRIEEFFFKRKEKGEFSLERDYFYKLKKEKELFKKQKNKDRAFNLVKILFQLSNNIKREIKENQVIASLSDLSYLIFLLDFCYELILELIKNFNLEPNDFKNNFSDYHLKVLELNYLRSKLFDYLNIFYPEEIAGYKTQSKFNFYYAQGKAVEIDYKTSPDDLLYNLQMISKNEFSYKIIEEKKGYKSCYLVEFYIRKIPLKVSFSSEDSLVEELICVVNEAYRKVSLAAPFYLLNESLGDSFYVIYLTDQIEIDQLKKENIIYQPNSISSYFKFSFIEN